jgi:hypothetical protein
MVTSGLCTVTLFLVNIFCYVIVIDVLLPFFEAPVLASSKLEESFDAGCPLLVNLLAKMLFWLRGSLKQVARMYPCHTNSS